MFVFGCKDDLLDADAAERTFFAAVFVFGCKDDLLDADAEGLFAANAYFDADADAAAEGLFAGIFLL